MGINKKKVTFSELQDKFLGLSMRPPGGVEKNPASSNKFENLDSSHFAFGVGIPDSILIAGSMDYPPSCKSSCGSCSSTVGSDGCEGCGCGSGGGGCGCSGGCGGCSGGGGGSDGACE